MEKILIVFENKIIIRLLINESTAQIEIQNRRILSIFGILKQTKIGFTLLVNLLYFFYLQFYYTVKKKLNSIKISFTVFFLENTNFFELALKMILSTNILFFLSFHITSKKNQKIQNKFKFLFFCFASKNNQKQFSFILP